MPPKVVDQLMERLPTVAAPGVAERAEALADAACELHDAASTPASWSANAVGDAVEAMETTALALLVTHPDAAAAIGTVAQALARLRQDLGLPARDDEPAVPADDDQDQAVTPPTPIRRPRARRGLGPGYQGYRDGSGSRRREGSAATEIPGVMSPDEGVSDLEVSSTVPRHDAKIISNCGSVEGRALEVDCAVVERRAVEVDRAVAERGAVEVDQAAVEGRALEVDRGAVERRAVEVDCAAVERGVNAASWKSTVPPLNAARLKSTMPPLNVALRNSTRPPLNAARLKSAWPQK
ncbi:hypothetical protein [Streptomyces mirabilis]|uniref:hypothetical protein n=1 Tax=Streptomyces mirabilis TaxID=68239 RepID=UPI0033B813B1